MSLDATHWVRKHSASKGAGRLIMLGIADAAPGADCTAYASYSYLQEWVNTTRDSTISDALKTLLKTPELIVVKGRTGPAGAAYYQLPLAVGHRRPAARNRSGYRSDSPAQIAPVSVSDRSGLRDESLRFADQIAPVTGAQNLKTPKDTSSSAPADPSATDGGGGGHGDNQGPAVLVVANLDYLGQAPTATENDQLVGKVQAALASGWSVEDLHRQLDLKGGNGIRSATAVYLKRLKELPPAAATASRVRTTLQPWCGKCNRGEEPRFAAARLIDLDDGRQRKCHCHPGYTPT